MGERERCFIHPERNSLAPCHSCGRYFCQECLIDGKEYYYCREEQCQLVMNQENVRFEAAPKSNSILFEQKWRENAKSFYRKMSIILGVAWVLLTVFLFIAVPSYKVQHPVWLPVLSLIICLKWFILAWLIRVTIYKHFIWERRIVRKFQAGQL